MLPFRSCPVSGPVAEALVEWLEVPYRQPSSKKKAEAFKTEFIEHLKRKNKLSAQNAGELNPLLPENPEFNPKPNSGSAEDLAGPCKDPATNSVSIRTNPGLLNQSGPYHDPTYTALPGKNPTHNSSGTASKSSYY